LTQDQQLGQRLVYLINLEQKSFSSRSRFAFYDYLAVVFQLYVQLRRRNQAKTVPQRIANLFCLRNRKHAHPIRVIIAATSTADNKTKSRWTRALQYAWRERREWRDLKAFLQESGGPAGCAARFAAVKSKQKDTNCVVYRCPGTGRPYLIVETEARGLATV
jgi:hypothetical protein